MLTNNHTGKKIWHIIIGGTVGNLMEWYNFLLYGYLAHIISTQFFPSKNELLSLTLTFTIFAVSFLVRPIGGILFGWIGDTYGRQKALVISLIMIAIPTFIIGCLPTYSQIGLASPILLSICRIFQGLSAGGEHTGSAIYLAELAPVPRRTLWVSAIPTSAALGILISSTTSLILVSSFSPEQLLSWGWRVGFWMGTLLCLVSIGIRLGMPETPDFLQKEKKPHRSPLATLFTKADVIKKLIITFVLAGGWGIFYQTLYIWMPTYLSEFEHLSHHTALLINSSYLFVFAMLVLLVGFCGDYINRKWLLVGACVAMCVSAFPLFILLNSGVLWKINLAMMIFTLIFSVYIPTAFISMLELFDVGIRFTALSFGFNCGLAFFGGTCPLILTWLIELTGNKTSPAFYMMVSAVFVLVISLFLHDKRGKPI